METKEKENVINQVKKETLSAVLVSLHTQILDDGKEIVCAVMKDGGDLHTKNTTRSYITAISGPEFAVRDVVDRLEEGDLSVVSGAKVTWERTTYAPGVPHEQGGQTVILDTEDAVDHILTVDVSPIKLTLLRQYLKELKEELSPLMEKITLKGYDVTDL